MNTLKDNMNTIYIRDEIKYIDNGCLKYYSKYGNLLEDFEIMNKYDKDFQNNFSEAKRNGSLTQMKHPCEITRKKWERLRKSVEISSKTMSIDKKSRKDNEQERKKWEENMKDITNTIKRLEDSYKMQEKLTKNKGN